jgi:hypothetical protein
MDRLDMECILRHSADFPKQEDPNEVMFREMLAFFRRQFELAALHHESNPP